jgi:hypothetical protein
MRTMKNLIAELLLRLAQKEEESKALTAQVEALEVVITALMRQMPQTQQRDLFDRIGIVFDHTSPEAQVFLRDNDVLRQYLNKAVKASA